MKQMLVSLMIIVGAVAFVDDAFAQNMVDQPVKPEITRLVDFTKSVAQASRLTTCEQTTMALDAIPDDLKRDAAYIVANMRSYEVSDAVIEKVSTFSKEAASKKTSCPDLLETYRKVAVMASSFKPSG